MVKSPPSPRRQLLVAKAEDTSLWVWSRKFLYCMGSG